MSAEEMGAEERLHWSNRVFLDMIRRMVGAVEERYGPEGRKAAADALYDVGRGLATQVCDLLHITGREPLDYAKVHCYLDTNLWGLAEEVIPGDGDEVTIRAYSCPAQGIFTPRDCKLFLPYVRGLMDGINPNLRWKAPKVLTRGDDCCEFIVSKET